MLPSEARIDACILAARSAGNDFRAVEPVPQSLVMDPGIVCVTATKLGVIEEDVDDVVSIIGSGLTFQKAECALAPFLDLGPIHVRRLLGLQDAFQCSA